MSRVRSDDTGPEIRVRKVAHALGLRFRLHRKDLPGHPDIVFPKWRIVLFVNGCFWHRHPGCKKATTPKSNVEFWERKFEANVARDGRERIELERLGWKVAVVWECETKTPAAIRARLACIFSLSSSEEESEREV